MTKKHVTWRDESKKRKKLESLILKVATGLKDVEKIIKSSNGVVYRQCIWSELINKWYHHEEERKTRKISSDMER